MNLTAREIKAFVPARDLAVSMEFYLALGFDVPWSSDTMDPTGVLWRIAQDL